MPNDELVEAHAVEIQGDSLPGESPNLPAVVEPAPVTLFRTDDPNEIVQRATEVADVLSRVLRDKALTSNISGREHVRVEGWTLCGSMLGVFPVVVWTRKLDDGWEARVEARTLSGAIVGAAEAECLRSEKTWKTRDDYAIRSMAQTRGISKALRGPLGFVVSLAGFDPTPQEEMPEATAAVVREHDPAVDLPATFPPGADLAKRIGATLTYIDPAVDWRGTWDNAIEALYDKPRPELADKETVSAWTRLANVAERLSKDGDFPPPPDAEIKAAFAWAFGGVVIDIERHEEPEAEVVAETDDGEPAPLSGMPIPEPDDTISFGGDDADQGS